jgi:hypothetical protein
MPLVLFEKQKDLVRFIIDMIDNGENGLVEKSRDMGASWVCCALSVWLLSLNQNQQAIILLGFPRLSF